MKRSFAGWLAVAAVGLGLAGCASQGSTEDLSTQSSAEKALNRARVHTELGVAYLGAGQFNTALEEGRTAVAADSSYAKAYDLLGLVYLQTKEYANAESNFVQAMRLAPDDSDIQNDAALFYCEAKRSDQAFPLFEAAAKNPLYATPARPLTNAARCAFQAKDYPRAEGYLVRALRYDRNALDAKFILAEVDYRLGRLADARAMLGEVHRVRDPWPGSAWLAVRIERKAGDREAELRWINVLRRNFPDSDEYTRLIKGDSE